MLPTLIILGLAALAILLAIHSYRRRAGATAGAGQGAPASPLLAIVLAIVVVVGAVLLFFLLRGKAW